MTELLHIRINLVLIALPLLPFLIFKIMRILLHFASAMPTTNAADRFRAYLDAVPFEAVVSTAANGETVGVHLHAPVEPRAARPPRFANGRAYDPLRMEKAEYRMRIERELRSLGVTDFPLFPSLVRHLKVDLRFGVSRKKDVDNMLKVIFDVLEGLIYVDDDLIYDVHARKVNSQEGFVDVTLSYL